MKQMKQNQESTRLGHQTSSGGEAPQRPDGADGSQATTHPENQVDSSTVQLMEEICERSNLIRAYQRVVGNKGAAGVDGMTVDKLKAHLTSHWEELKAQLLSGAYVPKEVRQVSIPKPNGGMRDLGIPTVLDRFIQQAMLQKLSDIFDPMFSESSYGFRPKRSAHQAILRAQQYVDAGKEWVVDIDLSKFFDRVNHDRLMARVAKQVDDKRVLRILRAFLNAGILCHGIVRFRPEGTPQGGPLSPPLSNIVLDELDKELEKRGHSFVRYADDCNIYVGSRKAGERLMTSLRDFVELKLKLNEEKSAVDLARRRKFLGYSFYPRP